MSSRLLARVGACLAVMALLFVPASTLAASAPAATRCTTQQVAQLTYRSDLLGAYKTSQDKKYETFRGTWSTRISYAGQWVKKDAEKTRDSLYAYDALHAASDKELTKQIKQYRYLETAKLSCSNKAAFTKALADAKGLQGKKVVGGNALIAKNKKLETDFLNKKFKKSSDAMIKKLHKAKQKYPKPQAPQLAVKSV